MGGCLSKFSARNNAVHPFVPTTDLQDGTASVEAGGNKQGSSEGEDTPETKHTVDPNVPESFYPVTVGISHEEERCRLARSKVAVEKSEKLLRQRVGGLLDEWRNGKILGQIESHALSVSARNAASVEILALSLGNEDAKYVKTIGETCPFALTVAKAYAIYFWISNNIRFSQSKWRSNVVNSDTSRLETEARNVLEERETIANGYANLFHGIATAMGLKSCVVMGYIKLSCSESHFSLRSNGFECSKLNQHWWNMFTVEGVWIPVDCTYGSGMTAPHLNYQHKFVPHYFAINPEHLIFSHIPARSDMQLLQEAISLNNIVPMISPSVPSFALGVEPLSWAETIRIDHDNPTTTVKISAIIPSNVKLSAKLRCVDEDKACEIRSQNTQNQKIFIQATGFGVDIYAAVPNKGLFYLDIYVHSDNEVTTLSSYQIVCMKKPVIYSGFPTVHDLPSTALKFRPLYWNTPLAANHCENSEGKMDLVFECQPGTYFNHFLVLDSKTSSGLVDIDAQHYSTVITRDTIDQSLYKLSVLFPATGWWTVYLCAVKAGNEVSGYTVLLRYTVLASRALEGCCYPHVTSSDINFNLDQPISCSGTEILVVPFSSTLDLKFHSYLSYENVDAPQCLEYTLVNALEGFGERKYVLKVVFPKPGWWYIRVFGITAQQTSTQGYLPLFDLFMHVQGCFKKAIFPRMEQDIMQKYDIQLLHPDYLVDLDDGGSEQELLLKFKARKTIKFDHYIEPIPNTTSSNPSDTLFPRYLTYLMLTGQSSSNNFYELKALYPRPGKWDLVLCAQETSLSDPEIALRLPVNVVVHHQEAVYPLVQSAFSEFGIVFPTDKIPYPRQCNFPEFTFDFESQKSVNFAWTLQDARSNKQIPHSSNIFIHTHNELHKLRLVFPKPGVWVVQVVARSVLSDIVADNTLSLSLHYQPVFNLIVEASTATVSDMSFPRLHESFTTPFGLHIYASDVPLPSRIYQLPAKCTIKFYSPPGVLFWHQCVESSQLQDKKITRMTSNPDTGLHELCADISKRGQWTVYLHAKFENDTSKNWTAVLQHTIIARSAKSISASSLSS